MLKRLAIIFSLSCQLIFSSSANADQLIPPTPSWWPSGGLDIRHGVWIPCNSGVWAVEDCLESIEIREKNNQVWTPLVLVPNPNFKPDSEKPVVLNPTGNNDYSFLYEQYGYWSAPSGFKTNSKNLGIYTDIGVFGSYQQPSTGVQAWMSFILRTTDRTVPLSNDFFYKIKLKTQNLKSYARSIALPSNQTIFDWSIPGFVTIIATPSTYYYPEGDWDAMCRGEIKNSKPNLENQEIDFIINFWDNEKNKYSPSQLVAASNGDQCFYGLSFDSLTNSLKVGVGTVQYDINGKLIEGWLDTWIERDLLIKWWNYDPVKTSGIAQVQVTNSDGKSTLISTTANYDKASQKLHIISNGFHYPLPEISIKIIPLSVNSFNMKSGNTPAGTVIQTDGSYSVYGDTYHKPLQVEKLKNGTYKIGVDYGRDFANQSYFLWIVETVKNKKVNTKLDNLKLNSQGKATLILKNRLVVGSVILASSMNKISVGGVSK